MSWYNHIQQAIDRNKNNVGFARLGTITSVDPVNYWIKANINPEEIEAGPMPFCTPWIGWSAPPLPGQQVLIVFQEGDKNVPIGALLLYWGQQGTIPPASVAAGEMELIHSSGASIKLTNSGNIVLKNGQSTVTIASDHIQIDSPAVQIGNLQNMVQQFVTAAMTSLFNTHTHGGGPIPDQVMGSSQLTAAVTGN